MNTEWVMVDNFTGKIEKLQVDEDGIVVTAEHGMPWVEMMTNRYGETSIKALIQAAVYNYRFYDESKEVKKDDDDEIGIVDVSKTDEDKRLAFGWAYITHDKDGNLIVDKSGEYVEDPDELEKAAYDYVVKSRQQGDLHQRSMANEVVPVGSMVESMVFTPEKIEKMGLPAGSLPTGWWVGFKVADDETWGAIKRGERKSFSIHGKAKRKEH